MIICLAVSFPDVFNITSTGPAAVKRSAWLGAYLKMDNVTRNNRPVWQKGAVNHFLFYNDHNYWVVDSSYSVNYDGYFRTVNQHLEKPPSYAWNFHNGTMMVEDPHLKAEEYEGKVLNT